MKNALKEKLGNDEVALGLCIGYPVPGLIEAAHDGWDWVWLDGQHGQYDYQGMIHCVRTANECGVAPVPRVPGHDYGIIGLTMDMNPAGIMVPMVNTPEDAKNVVNAVRFPPLGIRSFGGKRPIARTGWDYYKSVNEDVLLLAQIETVEAIKNVEAIAATDGVSVLFFGADDVKVSMGLPIKTKITESDVLARALERTAKAAKNAGKIAGCVATEAEAIKLVASLGFRMIAGGSDNMFVIAGAQVKLRELNDAIADVR